MTRGGENGGEAAPYGQRFGGRYAWLAALLLASAFCFTGLSNHPLRASDETRVAGIGWEMAHGDLTPIPHLGGEPFLEHPPLYYAILGGFIDAFGSQEGVARLPSAIAAFLTLLLVFDLGRRIASPLAGLFGVLVLASMRGFLRYSHKALADPLLTLFVLLGFFAYVWALWGSGSRALGDAAVRTREDARVSAAGIFGIYVAAALAFYVKGFVGIVAIAGPIAVDLLLFRRFHALKSAGHLWGIPLLFGVCASWLALLFSLGGETALQEFLVQNGVYRILPAAGEYQGGHEKPFWYYLGQLPSLLAWWLVFLPAVAVWIGRGAAPAGWNAGAIRFLGLVLPIGTLLLSIPATKRGLYLLPFLPPLSVAIGAWVAGLRLPDPHRSRVEHLVAALSARASWLFWPVRRREGERLAEGPARLAWLAFVGALAWNVVGYSFSGHDRDLGATSREIVAAVGECPLVGFSLPEEMRGALPFYTERIARNIHSEEALTGYLRGQHGRHLLALSSGNELQDATGGPFSAVGTWEKAERSYTLYEILPGIQAPPHCTRPTGAS